MAFFGNKTKEKSVLVCIVESGCVRLGLILLEPKKLPHLIYQVIEHVPFQETLSSERLQGLILNTLKSACDKMVREGLSHSTIRSHRRGRLDAIHIIYASPWHLSQSKTVTIENERPFMLTEKLIRDIVTKETQNMATAQKLLGGGETDAVSIIEERITNVLLNGYPVENPYGKETPRATVTLFASILSKTFRETVEETVERFIHSTFTYHHSLPLVLFSGIRDGLAIEKNFVIAIPGDEVTDIAYVHNDALVDTGSFPVGRATLIRDLAKTLLRTTGEVKSFFNKNKLQHLDEKTRGDVQDALMKSAGVWTTGLRETVHAMTPLSGGQTLVIVGGEESATLRAALDHERGAGAPGAKQFVRSLEVTGATVRSFCSLSGGIASPDPRIAFSALYVHKVDI